MSYDTLEVRIDDRGSLYSARLFNAEWLAQKGLVAG